MIIISRRIRFTPQKFVSGNPLVGHIVIFEHPNLSGHHAHIFNEEADLRKIPLDATDYVAGRFIPVGRRGQTGQDSGDSQALLSWNDQLSSFVVISGTWTFYGDINFARPYTAHKFTRGTYLLITDWKIPHDKVSSLSCMR